MVRVDLRGWTRANAARIVIWGLMTFLILGLLIRELGIYTLVPIALLTPIFIIGIIRMIQELRK